MAWCRNAIDRLILARLEKEGLRPAASADKLTLIREDLGRRTNPLDPVNRRVEARLAQ